jgi:hypothetical protein
MAQNEHLHNDNERLSPLINPLNMDNSLSKTHSTGLGHCIVCGALAKLEMWDDGLNGRFCVECFDYVVDAEELLESKGLVRPGPERKQEVNNT